MRKYLSQYLPKLHMASTGLAQTHCPIRAQRCYFLPGNISMNPGHIVCTGEAHAILQLVSEAARALANLFKSEGIPACASASYTWLAAFLRSAVAVADRDGLVVAGPAALLGKRAPSE